MSEFLFRGYCEEEKRFVYGDISYCPNQWVDDETPLQDIYMIQEKCEWEYFGYIDCKVLPLTVGQYIWREDIKGNKIFTGDIVEWDDGNYYNWQTVEGKKVMPRVVVPSIKDMLSDDWEHEVYIFNECEILGNIFDNPELMERK